MSYHFLLTECFNDRVKVTYDRESSTITCTFYDPQNITGKLCVIVYGRCNSQQLRKTLGSSTPIESPNIVTLHLQLSDPNQMYCYNITASSVSGTIVITGRIGTYGYCFTSVCMDHVAL